MPASQTFKTGFFKFSKGCAPNFEWAPRNRKENLKWYILMYSIGGWTGEGNIVLPAHAIPSIHSVCHITTVHDRRQGHTESDSD